MDESSLLEVNPQPATTPLVKWPGGKREIVADLLPLVPNAVPRYYEPFVGGGAMFFALGPDNAVLADNNADLINCYSQVKSEPEGVIDHLGRLANTEQVG